MKEQEVKATEMENTNQEEKPVKKTRQERKEEFEMNHPKITGAKKKLAKAGKYILKGALVAGGGILTATAILGREKKTYATVPLKPNDPAPQIDAHEGVDFKAAEPVSSEPAQATEN